MIKKVSLCCIFVGLLLVGHGQENPYLKAGEGWVNVNGGKLWYEIIGEGNEAPVVFMHGGPGGTSSSFYLFEKLSKDRPLILFDQLGTGHSSFHKDTSLFKVEEFVDQFNELKAALQLNEFYLYGHSWGTALALECYSADTNGIRGLIFNSPYFSTAIWEADADSLITLLPIETQEAIKLGEATGDYKSNAYQDANKVYLKNYGLRKKPLTPKRNMKPARGNYFMYNYMWGPTEFTATGTLKTYNSIAKLKKVNIPVLFITGEFDEARPSTVKNFQNMVPHSEFEIIKGAGHATMHDNLRKNKKAIRKFLKEN